MIRPFTCVCLVLAAGSGLYLYQVKQRAFALDAALRTTFHDIDLARERTRMLRADWALMNDPERLQALASQYLKLQPMQPSQLMTMDQLAAALPPPAAPAAAPAPETVTAPNAAKPAPVLDPSQGVPMAAATMPKLPPGHPIAPQVALLQPAAPAAMPAEPAAPAPASPPVAAAAPPLPSAPASAPAPHITQASIAPPPKPAPSPRPAHHGMRHTVPATPNQPWVATASPSQPERPRRPHHHEAPPPAAAPAQLYAANAPVRAEPRITPRAATVMYSASSGSALGMASSASMAPPRPLYSTSQ